MDLHLCISNGMEMNSSGRSPAAGEYFSSVVTGIWPQEFMGHTIYDLKIFEKKNFR